MDPRVADRVFRACSGALARAGAESIAPLATLPYPVETVRQALRAYAQDLAQTGRMTDQFREDLLNAYRALANFVSDEDMAVVEALSVPPDPNRTGPSFERARQLAQFGSITEKLRTGRAALETEFREFLKGLQAVAETSPKATLSEVEGRTPRPEGVDATTQ